MRSSDSCRTYAIRLVGHNWKSDKNVASWNYSYFYETDAVPLLSPAPITNFKLENGVLTWDAVDGADEYEINIYEGSRLIDCYYYYEGTNKADVNQYISELIEEEEVYDINSKFTFKITALQYHYPDYEQYEEWGDEPLELAKGTYSNYMLQIAPNPLSVKGKTATVKYKKLKKKKQTLAASKVITGLGTGRGPKTFTKVSGNKKISISKTTGKVTIKKKGLKKGKTYAVKVKIKAAGNYGYAPSDEMIVTFRIKVKK